MQIFLFMVFLNITSSMCQVCKIWEPDYHTALNKSWGIQHATHGPYEAFRIEKPHTYIADSFQKGKRPSTLTQHGSHTWKIFTA